MENEFSQDKLLARVNRFLKTHTFSVKYPLIDNFYPITIRVELTDFRELIRMGQYIKYLMYTIYIVPSGDEDTDKVMKNLLPGEKVINNPSSINQSTFYLRLCNDVDVVLENFLEYWGQDYPVFCNKLVNLYPEEETINENLIIEGKLDSVVRKITSDIIQLVKLGQEGEFSLPEDISSEYITYSFPQLETEFSVELTIIENESVSGFELNADYYRDEDVIEIEITLYPNSRREILQDLTGELNETLTHELTHMVQHESGYEFPEDPKKPYDYYTQHHELEAQYKGFMRRARAEKRSLESVMDDWFNKNQKKHRLKQKQIDKLKNKILRMGN
jgi:hypothetical protein